MKLNNTVGILCSVMALNINAVELQQNISQGVLTETHQELAQSLLVIVQENIKLNQLAIQAELNQASIQLDNTNNLFIVDTIVEEKSISDVEQAAE